MERLTYELRINTDVTLYDRISAIIGLQPQDYKYGWSYEVIVDQKNQSIDTIAKFLESLEGEYEHLHELGIESEDKIFSPKTLPAPAGFGGCLSG